MPDTATLADKTHRKAIKPSVRASVIARDGMACRYCDRPVKTRSSGEKYSPDHIHLDHVTPWALGGSDDADNLVVSCADCNLGRIRPPHGSAAKNRLLWEYEDGDYYWKISRYRTPAPLPSMYDGFSIDEAAEILECSEADILVMAVRGHVRATGGATLAIRIRFHPHMGTFVDRRVYELGWEDE